MTIARNTEICQKLDMQLKKLEDDHEFRKNIETHDQHQFLMSNVHLYVSVEIKQAQKQDKKAKQEVVSDVIKYFDNVNQRCNQLWDKLGGNQTVESFEKQWTQWSIEDTIK